jgi:serine/threonine protein kinase
MHHPLLLIVDGESLRTQGLERALERQGWDLAWTTSQQALNVGLMGQEPSLVCIDPSRNEAAAVRSVLGLREQNPALPVVVLRGEGPSPAGFPATASLERGASPEQWVALLQGYLPSKLPTRKLTTEDLFGDILADIGGTPAPMPKAAAPAAAPKAPDGQAGKPLRVQVPAPRLPVPKAPPVSRRSPVSSQAAEPADRGPSADAEPQGIVTAPPPEISAPILPELFGELLGPLETPVVPPRPEYTLSGLSGIHDPFGKPGGDDAGPSVPPQAAPAPEAVEPGSLSAFGGEDIELEFIGSSDHTPATRPPSQGAASLVHQPPPKVPVAPEPELPGSGAFEEFGNYYLLEKIAVGGMAELFKARQRGVHNFEKIVAIKRILPHLSDNDEFVRMFIDEAKLAAQLTHPNIVQIFDLGKAGGFYYIAMEYVDGKDLRSLLRKVREYRQPFPEAVAAYVTMKVATALDYAHRKRGMNEKELKLVHRDVSPQNVLISSDGAVKLVDFGIAKAATKSTQTMAGALKGKLLYMSPEQALGQSLDNRSDIYSLGLVLFELLTGERCFQADSELGVLEKVRLGRVQDVQVVNPNVSRDMANILAKALQKNVDQRYASARLMERDLKSLLVRHANEPTDHEVAEYVNTLLRGTREQLDAMLAEHFAAKPVRPRPEPGAAITAIHKIEDPPTRIEPPPPAQARPVAPPETRPPSRRELPRWLLPALLSLALFLLLIVWYFARITGG